jgi:hypothetical protein
MMPVIMPYDPRLAASLADRLRASDRQELALIAGVSPREAFAEIESEPGEAWLACVGGVPVAAFGCAAGWLGRIGTPWFLAAPEVQRYPVSLVRISIGVVERWRRAYLLLENYCAADRCETINWLRRLGFSFDEPVRLPGGGRVRRFWLQGGAVCVLQ